MAGLGLVHSLYRAHRAVVPAAAWHLLTVLVGSDFIKNCYVNTIKVNVEIFCLRLFVGYSVKSSTHMAPFRLCSKRHLL